MVNQTSLFITATDTGAGKTRISCLLAKALVSAGKNVGVCKPIASGAVLRNGMRISEDAFALREAANSSWPLSKINPNCLTEALAPNWSAKLEGRRMDPNGILHSIQTLQNECDILIVEGIGGLRVPITNNYFVLDLIAELGFPVLLVARNSLGTLNHTLLSLDALRDRGVKVQALALNNCAAPAGDIASASNAENLRSLLPANFPLVEIGWNEESQGKGIRWLLNFCFAE